MPRYFFHVHDDLALRDRDGIELADAEAAGAAALAGARAMMCEQLTKGRLDLCCRIEVVDEEGKSIRTLFFGEAAGIVTAAP